MEYDRSKSRLQRLCSRAEYCSSDIYKKALKDLEGDAESASRLVAELVSEHYVDDVRYSSAFAREKSSIQGWGPIKIRFQLRAKGVGEDAINEGLREIDRPKADRRMEKLLAEKYRSLKEDPQCRLKLLKFGLTRGYEYGDVSAAIENILNQ